MQFTELYIYSALPLIQVQLLGRQFTGIMFHKLKEQKSRNEVDSVPNHPGKKKQGRYQYIRCPSSNIS